MLVSTCAGYLRHLFQKRAVLAQHTPEIHHSDQGVHYAASAYTTRLLQAGVFISILAHDLGYE